MFRALLQAGCKIENVLFLKLPVAEDIGNPRFTPGNSSRLVKNNGVNILHRLNRLSVADQDTVLSAHSTAHH